MKVIFLDIDGVLNSVGFRPENPQGVRDWLAEENVRVLRGLVESTGAVIVLTTSWRLTTSVADIASALLETGAELEVVGVTPSLAPGSSRAAEIQQWLQSATSTVEAWVALDDDWVGDGESYFRVSKLSGLTEADAVEIARLLND